MTTTTILIPNYNGIKLLKDCLESLKNQTLLPSKVIIVDNGSTDGSQDYIKRVYPDVELISLGDNYGFTGAINLGLEQVTTDYVVLLNNDTIARPNWLEELVAEMMCHPDAFSCSSKMLQVQDESVIDDAGDGYCVMGWSVRGYDGKSAEEAVTVRQTTSTCAGAAIYDMSRLRETGFLDDRFFAYLEDVDLSLRAMRYGYRHYYCPAAEIVHLGSATTGSKYNEFKVRISARNSIWLIKNNFPLWIKILNFIFFFMGVLIKQVFFIKKGFGKDYFEGIMAGLMGTKASPNVHNKGTFTPSLKQDLYLYKRMWQDLFFYIKMKS